jgi:hypothetical protein
MVARLDWMAKKRVELVMVAPAPDGAICVDVDSEPERRSVGTWKGAAVFAGVVGTVSGRGGGFAFLMGNVLPADESILRSHTCRFSRGGSPAGLDRRKMRGFRYHDQAS